MLDSTGLGMISIPFGSYTYSAYDPAGVYGASGSFDFTTDEQVISLVLNAAYARGWVQFAATTNDGGNPEGVSVSLIGAPGSPFNPTVELDSSGSATALIALGSYSYTTNDTNGIYGQVIGNFDFTVDGQIVPIALETYLPHGTVTFVATTSDGGIASDSWISITSEDHGGWYPGRHFGEDNTATVPRLPHGLYEYEILSTTRYEGATGLFVVDDATETVNLSLEAIPHGTLTLDGTTSDGESAEGIYVEIIDTVTSWIAYGYLDENNDVTFDQIPYGTYTYIVSPTGIYERFEGTITVDAPSVSTTLTIQAKPNAVLTFNITTSDGGSAQGASVELRDTNGFSVAWGYVDGNQQATIDRVLYGDYTWHIASWDIYSEASGALTVATSEVAIPVTLEAQLFGAVVFDGTSSDGLPATNTTIRVYSDNNAYSRIEWLNDSNDAIFSRIPYGTYNYEVINNQGLYETVEGQVTVAAETLTVTFTLPALPSGTVLFEANTDDDERANDVLITIRNDDGDYVTDRYVGWDNTVSVRLPYGAYTFSTGGNSIYLPTSGSFTVDSANLTVIIDLEAGDHGTVILQGTTEDGESAEWAYVTLMTEFGYYIDARSLDEDNAVSFSRLPYGNYTFRIDPHNAYEGLEGSFTIDATEVTVPFTLTPLPHATVTVNVTSSDGGNIGDAWVMLQDEDGWFLKGQHVGNDNVVIFDRIVYGDYRIQIDTYDIYPEVTRSFTVSGPDVSLDIELEAQPYGTLVVQATTSDGERAASANVFILTTDGTYVRGGYLDDNNRVAFKRMPHGDYTITIPAFDVYERFESATITHDADETVVDVPLTAMPNGVATLVATTSGLSAEGVEIQVRNLDDSYVAAGMLDASNTLELPRLPYGTYIFSVSDRYGVFSADDGRFTIDSAAITVPFTLVGVTGGAVLLDGTTSDGGQVETWIDVFGANGSPVAQGILDRELDFAIPRLPDGTYTFLVRGQDIYGEVEGSFTVDSADLTVDFTLTALPYGSLTLTVTATDGGNVRDLQFSLYDDDTGIYAGYMFEEDGIALQQRLPYGTYRVTVWDPYYVYQTVMEQFTFSPDATEMHLTVSPESEYNAVHFSGTTDDGGNPQRVFVDVQGATIYAGTSLDSNGAATLPRLPYGEYTYRISDPYLIYTGETGTFTVDATSLTIGFDLVAAEPHGMVTFKGTTSDGGSSSDVRIAIQPFGNFRAAPMMDDLEYVFLRAPYGDYTFKVVDQEGIYKPVEGTFTVDGPTLVVNFTLEPVIPAPTPTPVTPTPTPVTPTPTPVTPTPTPVTPTPTPVTPTPTETVTPEPSETATVTPEPSETATATVTPVETGTPEPSVTPAETTTPEPSVTPIETVTPEPSPSVTPGATTTPVETPVSTTTPAPAQVPMETSFTLCGNEECAPPHNTGADGFTASWTVTEETEVSSLARQTKIASVHGGSGSVPLSALQQDAPRSWTITAVIQGGVATGLSEPLPLGDYRVCLNPILTGPDGSTIRIANGALCDLVTLTQDGPVPADPGSEREPAAFAVVLLGAPDIIPPATEPPGQDGDPSETPAPPDSDDGAGEAPDPAETPGSPAAGTTGSTSGTVTSLPNTGAGNEGSSIAVWILAAGATALMATAIGIRHRSRL